MAETRLSLMTLHDDGTATHLVWKLPAEEALDISGFIAAAYGTPAESISSADAVQRLVALELPGVVDL